VAEHGRDPAAFGISAAGNLRIQSIIASWNAQLPADLSAPEATWSLGPAGCVLVELAH